MEKVRLGGKWLGDQDDSSGMGLKLYNLNNTLKRWKLLNRDEGLDKEIRKTFIGYEGSTFTPEQINYAKDDIKYLEDYL